MYMKPISLILFLCITVVISLMIFSGAKNIAYAHTFSGDESASFLTLVEEIRYWITTYRKVAAK